MQRLRLFVTVVLLGLIATSCETIPSEDVRTGGIYLDANAVSMHTGTLDSERLPAGGRFDIQYLRRGVLR